MTAEPKLTVSFTTRPVGNPYAPTNVVAAWIQGPSVGANLGPFVKTIGRWADIRKPALVAWKTVAGLNDADAISGATRQEHVTPLTVEWDLKNKLGEIVPDGVYTIRLETADGNSTAAAQNFQGSFTFTKGLTRDLKMIAAEPPAPAPPEFIDITIDFNPTANECNNMMVDTGELCDGNCPTSCPVTEDACAPSVLTGSAATCNAACVIQAVTTCVNGDGCCAVGCGPTTDDDCASAGDLNQTGCSTGTGNGSGALLAFGLVGLAALFSRRRR